MLHHSLARARQCRRMRSTVTSTGRYSTSAVPRGQCLANRVFAVTGADTGLGLATTAALVESGARVHMGCADLARGESLAEAINELTQKPSVTTCGVALDLGRGDSILSWSDNLQSELQHSGIGAGRSD